MFVDIVDFVAVMPQMFRQLFQSWNNCRKWFTKRTRESNAPTVVLELKELSGMGHEKDYVNQSTDGPTVVSELEQLSGCLSIATLKSGNFDLSVLRPCGFSDLFSKVSVENTPFCFF